MSANDPHLYPIEIRGIGDIEYIVIIKTIDPNFIGILGRENFIVEKLFLFILDISVHLDFGLLIVQSGDFEPIILIRTHDHRKLVHDMIIPVRGFLDIFYPRQKDSFDFDYGFIPHFFRKSQKCFIDNRWR